MALINPNNVKKRKMMNLTGRVPLKLYRSSGGGIVDFEWVENLKYEVDIEANIQPFKAYELYQMSESERKRVWLKVYSESEIKGLIDGDDAHKPDEFEWDGDRYMVTKVFPYKMGVLDHYKAIAYKIRTTAK